jgi:hypothetical protein
LTRADLNKLGVPAKYHDAVIDLHNRDVMREAIRYAGQALKDSVAELPQAERTAVRATLMALTPELAAKRAGCSRRTIDRAIEDGFIMAVRGSTGLVNVDRDSFNAWHAARVPALPTMSKHREN